MEFFVFRHAQAAMGIARGGSVVAVHCWDDDSFFYYQTVLLLVAFALSVVGEHSHFAEFDYRQIKS